MRTRREWLVYNGFHFSRCSVEIFRPVFINQGPTLLKQPRQASAKVNSCLLAARPLGSFKAKAEKPDVNHCEAMNAGWSLRRTLIGR